MPKRIIALLFAVVLPMFLAVWLSTSVKAGPGINVVTVPDIHSDDGEMIWTQYVITNSTNLTGNLIHTFYEPGGTVIWVEADSIDPQATNLYDLATFAQLPFFFVGYLEISSDVDIAGNAVCGDNTPPIVAFEGMPRVGAAPLAVTFTNQTCGDYNTLIWSFGDGTVSFGQNPTHEYTDLDVFTVTLSVSGPNFTRESVQPEYIDARPRDFLPIIVRP